MNPDPRGKPLPENDRREIVQLLRQGQFIPAIKLYRDRTGAQLAESKAAVEAIEKEEGIQRPKTPLLEDIKGPLIIMLATLAIFAVIWAILELF